jgi:hypothetical protein
MHAAKNLLVTAKVVPSSPIFVSLIMEAVRSSETSVLTRATRRHIPEDCILHSHRRENFKPYMGFYDNGVKPTGSAAGELNLVLLLLDRSVPCLISSSGIIMLNIAIMYAVSSACVHCHRHV